MSGRHAPMWPREVHHVGDVFDAMDQCGGWTTVDTIMRRSGLRVGQVLAALRQLRSEARIVRADRREDPATHLHRIGPPRLPAEPERGALLPNVYRPANIYQRGPIEQWCVLCGAPAQHLCWDRRSRRLSVDPPVWAETRLRPHPERRVWLGRRPYRDPRQVTG
jgi:hypothetical protein